MSISPQKNREIIFQLLYSDDFGGAEEEIIEMLMSQLSVTKRIVREANLFKNQILERKDAIDELIKEYSESYAFERIPRVERNLLRLGIYELLFSKAVPPKVVIAEAIRLSRKFSTPESAAFINAILDEVYKEISTQQNDVPALSSQTL